MALLENSFADSSGARRYIPEGKSLRKFQREAVQTSLAFLHSNETNSIYNCCEQGLGKTIISAVTRNILLAKIKKPRTLIVCPAIARLMWEDVLNEWSLTPQDIYVVQHGGEKFDTKRIKTAQTVIISYDLLVSSYKTDKGKKVYPHLRALAGAGQWDLLVADELHYCKTRKTARTKAVLGILWKPKYSRFKIGLSGTPFTTRVIDGYTAFNAIMPSRFGDFWEFAREFSYIKKHQFGHDFYGVKRPKRLRKLVRSNFMIRYLKKDVLPELPEKTYVKIPLPVEYSVRAPDKTYEEKLRIDAHLIKKAIEDDRKPTIPPTIAEHRKLQGMSKLPAVIDFVRGKLEQDIPVVLFGWHKEFIAELKYEFRKYKPAVITGATPDGKRKKAIRRFQKGRTNLFIGNLVAAGVVITLTRASTVVLGELDWSPAVIDQATDRVHRMGQKDPVTCYYFVVRNSIDETISAAVINRSRIFKKVLDG